MNARPMTPQPFPAPSKTAISGVIERPVAEPQPKILVVDDVPANLLALEAISNPSGTG